jgi:peptide/nickel transport system permease protein
LGTYLVKRLLLALITLLGITVISFGVMHLAPGSPVDFLVRGGAEGGLDAEVTREMVEQTRKNFGFDKPLHIRYLLWLKKAFTLDFGRSYKDQRPVRTKIFEGLLVSIQISFTSVILIYLIAVPVGVFCAVEQDTLSDRLITIGLFILYSLPNFWVGTLMIVYLCNEEYLNWFPVSGLSSLGAEDEGFWHWLGDRLWHLVLPIACMTYTGLASLSRYARSGMLEVIRQDYITTARAKGLSEKMVIFRHALRNSLIPIVTLAAALLPALLGGSVIIESIFSIPGMGKLTFEAILSRDYNLIMGIFTVSAILTLLGILLSDILYVLIDPRISFEKR